MFEARFLGQFSLRLNGAPIELPGRPAQLLLAFLMLNAGVAQRRERLAGLLWPDSSEANARRNLRQALWQIRRALGEAGERWLLADDTAVTFNGPEDLWLDVAEVGRGVEAHTPTDALLAEVAAYGGELLLGFYDEWVLRERDRLYAQFERKIALLLDRLLDAGRWEDTVAWAEHWIALGQTPEPAYRALMLAYAGLGDTAGVAAAYRRCCEALARDLDVEPAEQTQALYERLRSGERPAAQPPEAAPRIARARRHNLPVPLTSFVGRSKEMEDICRLVTRHRLVTLTGPGGAGKTRLALQVAHTIADFLPDSHRQDQESPAGSAAYTAWIPPELRAELQAAFGHGIEDGVWLVELAAVTDPELAPQAVATVLGVREEPGEPLARTLVSSLRSKSLLLILDNCEHLVEACARLASELLHSCPRIRILATSRETLGVPGEAASPIPPLALPDAAHLPPLAELAQYEAIQLFTDRAAMARPDFRLTEENAAAIVHICRDLDGLPLAIELAAARIRAMTPAQIATRLGDRFRLLTGGSRTALPRHQTLRAAIEWSWNLLTEPEQALLCRLSVFAGGWTLEAAEAIAGSDVPQDPQDNSSAGEAAAGPALPPLPDLLDLLARLIEKSLVRMEERDGEARYSLLETIRQYAYERLVASGDDAAVHLRHLHHFLKLAEAAEPALRAAEQLIWLARLGREHDNLRAALRWAAANRAHETGLRLAGSLARFWYLRGYWQEGRSWLKLLLDQSLSGPDLPPSLARVRAKALYGAGWLADEDGSEIALYTESLALCRQVGDRWGEAFCLRGLASVTLYWSNLVEGMGPRLQESLAIFQALHDDWGMALVHLNLGWLAFYYDAYAESITHWQEGLALFERCGDRWGIAVTLSALSFVVRLQGGDERATELTNQSLVFFQELGDQAGIAFSLTRLGNLALRQGSYLEATALLRESLHLQRSQGIQQSIIATLQALGLAACYQGDAPAALVLLEESVALAQERDSRYEIGVGLSYQALVHYRQGDLDRAETLFGESLALFHEEKDAEEIAFVQHGLGLVALRRGDFSQAGERLHRSLTLWQSRDDAHATAAVLDSLGQLAQAQGEQGCARRYFRESLQARAQIRDKQGIAETLDHLAAGLSDAALAASLLGAADALREAIGAPVAPVEQAEYEARIRTVRDRLGDAAFQAAWREGATLAPDQVVARALASDT